MLHKNYFNIIPILLIEIIIVYMFEYIVFVYSIKPGVLNATSRYLSFVIRYGKIFDNPANNADDENKYIKTQNTYSILIITFTIIGIFLLLLLYKYIVENVFNKNIEWFLVFIVVFVLTSLILIMEAIYIFKIEHETKDNINDSHSGIIMNNVIINYIKSTKFTT